MPCLSFLAHPQPAASPWGLGCSWDLPQPCSTSRGSPVHLHTPLNPCCALTLAVSCAAMNTHQPPKPWRSPASCISR